MHNSQGCARILNLIRTLLHRAHYVELVRDTCAAVHNGTDTDLDGMFDEIQRICSTGTDDMVMVNEWVCALRLSCQTLNPLHSIRTFKRDISSEQRQARLFLLDVLRQW